MLDPRSPIPHYADHNEGGVCRIHGWRCLHITMLAVFADHDDGGVCRSRRWRCSGSSTRHNSEQWLLASTTFTLITCTPGTVSAACRFLGVLFFVAPPISYRTFYPNAVHTMLDPRPFAFLSWGLGLPNTSIGPLPFHKLKLNSTRGSTVSAGLQPPADQRAIAPTPGWSF